jgi:hypothetical protein
MKRPSCPPRFVFRVPLIVSLGSLFFRAILPKHNHAGSSHCHNLIDLDFAKIGLEDELPIQYLYRALILPNNVQLLMRDILGSALPVLLWTLASSSTAIALVIIHHRDRIRCMHQRRNAGYAWHLAIRLRSIFWR